MGTELLYVGTFRRAHRDDPVDVAFGIYGFMKNDPAEGFRCLPVTEIMQPGWLVLHPGGRFLYAVSEVKALEDVPGGAITAFAIDPHDGSLTLLNSRRTPPQPCHCGVDASGRYLLVATFGGGSVHLFPIDSSGHLGAESDAHVHTGSSVHPRRQTQPHAHAVVIDPANRYVLVPDLGTDAIFIYELDLEAGKMLPRPERTVQVRPGSGPRHAAFDSQGNFVYLINEMNASIATFTYDKVRGAMREIQTIDLLPQGFPGLRSGGEIAIHPGGRFLYATTRSHGSSGEPPVRGLDQLLWFEIDAATGMLRPLGAIPSGGEIPRSFTFDSGGQYLHVGHQCSGTIVTFRIDRETGTPVASGEVTFVPAPVCVLLSVMGDAVTVAPPAQAAD